MSNESVAATDKNDVTEEIPAVITKELIEGAVRKMNGRDDVTLANYSVTSGSKYGAGFMSATFVVDAEVKDGNSTEATSIFAKTMMDKNFMSQWVRDCGLFKKEVAFYNDLVPDLIKLRSDRAAVTTPWNPPIPRFYGGFEDVENKEGIVMVGNLRPLGFTMADVKKGLDYDHCQLVFKAIAEMHAMSLAFMKTAGGNVMAEKYGDVSFDVYMSDCFDDLWQAFKPAFKDRLDLVKSKLRAAGSQLAKAVEELSTKLCPDPVGVLNKILAMPAGSLGVVCHGDLWNNNMMFRYDKENTPVEVKLIDWQIWRLGLPTTDLAMFLFTSTTQSVRREHLDDLLRLYHVTFMETLRGVSVDAPEFTFEALKEMFQRTAIFGMIIAYDMLPAMLADEKGLGDIGNVDKAEDFYATSAYDVTHLAKNGLLTDRFMEIAEDAVWLGLEVN